MWVWRGEGLEAAVSPSHSLTLHSATSPEGSGSPASQGVGIPGEPYRDPDALATRRVRPTAWCVEWGPHRGPSEPLSQLM